MCRSHDTPRTHAMSRRRFLSASAAFGVVGGVCAQSFAELPRGQIAASVHGCTEVEPFPGSDEFKESVENATSEVLAAAEVNVQHMAAANVVDEGTRPAEAAAMILEGTGPAAAPLEALAAPLDEIDSQSLDDLLIPRMALQRAKLWNRERGVTIAFINKTTDTACYQALQNAIDVWKSKLDMKLTRTDLSSADVRIGFRFPGFFSLVGTDSRNSALSARYGGQSLNVQPNLSGQHYLSVALHELGHALGAIHEHQSPSGSIPWDRAALYRYYGGPPNKWSPQQVDYQIIQKYNREQVNASEFDRTSIMLYPVLEQLLDKSKPNYRMYIAGWNRSLSERDISFMQEHYGRGGQPTPEPDPKETSAGQGPGPSNARTLRLGDHVQGNLAQFGEVHWYRVEVTRERRYAFETVEENPATNMLLELYESGDLTRPKASASYGGRRLLNAKLSIDLRAGTYYLRASHRNHYGIGRYVLGFHEE